MYYKVIFLLHTYLSNIIFKSYLQFNSVTISSHSLLIALGYLFSFENRWFHNDLLLSISRISCDVIFEAVSSVTLSISAVSSVIWSISFQLKTNYNITIILYFVNTIYKDYYPEQKHFNNQKATRLNFWIR